VEEKEEEEEEEEATVLTGALTVDFAGVTFGMVLTTERLGFVIVEIRFDNSGLAAVKLLTRVVEVTRLSGDFNAVVAAKVGFGFDVGKEGAGVIVGFGGNFDAIHVLLV